MSIFTWWFFALLMVFLFPKAMCTLEGLVVFERISAFKPFELLLFLLNESSLHLMVQGLCMYKHMHV